MKNSVVWGWGKKKKKQEEQEEEKEGKIGRRQERRGFIPNSASLVASEITRCKMILGANWSRWNKKNRNHGYTIPIISTETHLFSLDSNYFKITRSVLSYKHKLTIVFSCISISDFHRNAHNFQVLCTNQD